MIVEEKKIFSNTYEFIWWTYYSIYPVSKIV